MHRATRPAALMLSFLLAHAAVPVRAAGLRASQIAPVATTAGDGEVQLRLRNTSQLDNSALSDRIGAQEPQSTQGQATTATGNGAGASVQSASGPAIETIQLGEVSGTICDCGEIPILGGGEGGFPLGFFPLFALGALPLAFVDFGGEENQTITRVDVPTPPPVPVPSPTPTEPIPEPTTLLLFGTGLAAIGARARRRRRGEELASSDASAQVAGEEV